MWVSSLTDSTAKGKPDIELVDMTSRVNTINEILEVSTKPIILDGDTGGRPEHFSYMVRTFERLGVSAIIIEDKKGLKKNSLFGTSVEQTQATIEEFTNKIRIGKNAQATDDFMIIARIESLILKTGMEDALKRAKASIEAGADGIMIHSKSKTPDEIKEFCKGFNKFENKVPLIVVPTTYNQITEEELAEAGVNLVIYANHLLRSAYPAMAKTAASILKHHRSLEADDLCMPIKEILTLIPGGH
jgi:phosphoenolpyruvate phosphomutase